MSVVGGAAQPDFDAEARHPGEVLDDVGDHDGADRQHNTNRLRSAIGRCPPSRS
jgi:hypothetical protein